MKKSQAKASNKKPKLSIKRLLLKGAWFSLSSFFVLVTGTLTLAILLNLNGEATITRNDFIAAVWLDAFILVGLLLLFVYVFRKKRQTLVRWTRRSFVALSVAVFLVAIPVTIHLVTNYANGSFASVQQNEQSQSGVAGSEDFFEGLKLQEQALLDETNRERTANGRAGLTLNNKLSTSAYNKCQDMVTKNYWSHNDPAGNEPWHFITDTTYQYATAGENLAYGFNTEVAVVAGWMNSEGHRKNILDSEFTEVGFGMCKADNYINTGKQMIVVQHFARPGSSSNAQPRKSDYKPYVAPVCTKTTISYKTTTVYKSYMYEDETQVWGSKDGYIQTCTADSTGYKPQDLKLDPYDKEIWVGTKSRTQSPAYTPPPKTYEQAATYCSGSGVPPDSSAWSLCISAYLNQ